MNLVVHVMGQLRASGMERMLESALPIFAGKKVESVIIAQGKSHPFASALREAGSRIEVFERGISREPVRFRLLIRELRPAAIHIHTESNYLMTAALSRFAGGSKPAIVRTIHNVFHARGTWRLKRLVQAVIGDHFVDEVIAPSLDVAINERHYMRSPKVILNWVAPRFLEAGPSSPPPVAAEGTPSRTAVIVGNCSAIKNHELALRAARAAGWRVIHVGDASGMTTDERTELAKLKSLGATAMAGSEDPLLHLRSADAFLMPSRHEGMGVALAEAIAVGLPCAIADTAGMRWAHGVRGVSPLPLEHESWFDWLRTFPTSIAPGSNDAPDFSAERGVAEYLVAYDLASSKRDSHP